MTQIILTEHSKQRHDIVFCQSCDKKLANYVNDQPIPSFKELYEGGAIPVPNFGWICSQECAERLEKKCGIQFARVSGGKIDYYNGSLE
jgi:hypothetical protein